MVPHDRGPLDAPHCRDCGWEFDTKETELYDRHFSFIFPYRMGQHSARPNPFKAKEAT